MKLTHPDAKRPIDVKPDHAEAYKSQGWVEVDEKPADQPDPKK